MRAVVEGGSRGWVESSSSSSSRSGCSPFGPFNLFTQRRWKKPADTALTRLHTRTRDLKLDRLTAHLHKLVAAFNLLSLMSNNRRGPFVSLQLMSRWRNLAALGGGDVAVTTFLRKHPHIFHVFPHPLRKNPHCCRITQKMASLIQEEERAIRLAEPDIVRRLKKLLMLSVTGSLHIHALRLAKKELGLPNDFRDSILGKYPDAFKLVDLEIVSLVAAAEDRDAAPGVAAEVEGWRENECRSKWLSEFETKYVFPMDFPTGFKKEAGFREKLRNWQRLHYLKPYGVKESVAGRVRSCGGIERFEKRVVAVLHEFLSLTVEKMVEIDKLVHFRKDLGVEVNLRELLLKHPGIFYISTKGSSQTVFLREAYCKGCLINPNPIYEVRRKMLDLLLLRNRNTRDLKPLKEFKKES